MEAARHVSSAAGRFPFLLSAAQQSAQVALASAGGEGDPISFKLTTDIVILLKSKQARPTDLKAGMQVRVAEGENGVAETVSVQDEAGSRLPPPAGND